MGYGQFQGGIADYYKYGLIRQLIGGASSDGPQLSCALFNLSEPPNITVAPIWNVNDRDPAQVRAFDPSLANAFDEAGGVTFERLQAQGQLPNSTIIHWSGPPFWTAGVVSEAACQDYLHRRDAWLSRVRSSLPPVDLLVVEPGFSVKDRLNHEVAQAQWDEWLGRYTAEGGGSCDDEFREYFFFFNLREGCYVYWEELTTLWDDGHSLLVFRSNTHPEVFASNRLKLQRRFAEVAPGAALIDAVSLYFVHGWMLAIQPRHADALLPRWRALPRKLGWANADKFPLGLW